MIRWLYRYVFRGLGIVFVIVILTILISAISSQRERSIVKPSPATTARP
jgi:hypothetical protein